MAYKKIYSQEIYSYEQEEIIDKQLVAGDDGVVNEVETLTQEYAKISAEIVVYQENVIPSNTSKFRAEIVVHATAGENGEGFSFQAEKKNSGNLIFASYVALGGLVGLSEVSPIETIYTVQPGETKEVVVKSIQTDETYLYIFDTFASGGSNNLNYIDLINTLRVKHYLDGSFNNFSITYRNAWNKNETISNALDIVGNLILQISGLTNSDGTSSKTFRQEFSLGDISSYTIPNDRAMYPTTANNFTDEENASFTYRVNNETSNTITLLQAALSLDGETVDIAYRDIPVDGNGYIFELTEAEREVLRQKAQGSDTVPIYYLTKIIYTSGSATAEFIGKIQRFFTVVGCNPSLNPTVKDIKEETLALTGDENTFIRYESMAEFAINAVASKHAEIVTQSVTCGSKTIEGLPYGVIEDVESGTFNFYVADSRGMAAASAVFKNFIEYVKPTCYQKVEIELSGETGANIKVTINGNYYSGWFGNADNTLRLQVRYTDDNGNMGNWITLHGDPNFDNNTYELETVFSGFDYGKSYVFQCRATDKLNTVESSQYTIRLLPVFDWSETDFNFNVPVNIDADNLDMHGKTVLRHNETANNTVLSASGGHIYIRPSGTDETDGETIFYPNGDVKFNGTVTFADGTTGGGSNDPTDYFADYVIEIGEEAMGSNGTWYWRKWNSGKAEAWGCRNYGNMAVTTTWGNLYRSAIFTQDLPDNVFIRTPDSININIVHGGYGGWICKHEQTAPSAITTGSFIYVRPASATVTPSNLGFHIIGEWK